MAIIQKYRVELLAIPVADRVPQIVRSIRWTLDGRADQVMPFLSIARCDRE
jgi:hypothetical protein